REGKNGEIDGGWREGVRTESKKDPCQNRCDSTCGIDHAAPTPGVSHEGCLETARGRSISGVESQCGQEGSLQTSGHSRPIAILTGRREVPRAASSRLKKQRRCGTDVGSWRGGSDPLLPGHVVGCPDDLPFLSQRLVFFRTRNPEIRQQHPWRQEHIARLDV